MFKKCFKRIDFEESEVRKQPIKSLKLIDEVTEGVYIKPAENVVIEYNDIKNNVKKAVFYKPNNTPVY